MISNASIQHVRDTADIVDIVGHFLPLKKRGINYLTNCPFHNEKTPSFNVNPSKGIFKCFGCGKAGDSVTFVQEYEKFSFIEAIKWLADFYRIELEETQVSNEQLKNRQIEESLRILMEFAIKYFQNNLVNTEEGKLIGLSYYKERGFNQHIIEHFRLGYALESWDHFYKYAIKSGYNEDLLVQSGLITRKNDKIYDTYRGRVIFPIISNTGKVVGLGARILNTSLKAPKYINSPESEIYNKSKILYGLFQSRNAISKYDECYLVEGYTDVISMHQYGVENVVASSGTSLTEGQLKLIKNLTKNLTIIYDGDAAGMKAAVRGMQMAVAERYNINIVLLPDGEDPDSFVQKNGEAAFRQFVKTNKKDIVDFQIDLAVINGPLDAMAKSNLANEVAETIAKIDRSEDFVLQQEYIRKAAAKLQIDENGLIQLVNKLSKQQLKNEQKKWVDQSTPEPPVQVNNTFIDDEELAAFTNYPEFQNAVASETNTISQPIQSIQVENKEEWEVLQCILKYGTRNYIDGLTVVDYFFQNFELNTIENSLCKSILLEYFECFNNGKNEDEIILYFIRHDNSSIKNKVIDLLHDPELPNPKWETNVGVKINESENKYIDVVKSAFAYFEFRVLQKLIQVVLDEIKNKNHSLEETMELMLVHKDLKEKEKSLMDIAVKRNYI